MHFTVAIVTLFAGLATALPTQEIDARQVPYAPCTGLTSQLQCCGVDVLNLADIDCSNPSVTPTNGTEFEAICLADGGKRARCCLLPILGQGLVCSTPSGVVP